MNTGSAVWRDWLELALLLAFAAALGGLVSGHYARPHADVLEIWETGEALWSGQWPPTFKRAPLQPLLVAGLSRIAAGLGFAEPPAAALAWLSVLLLPLNVWLLWRLARRLCGAEGAWVGWWFAALPLGMSLTAFGLAEPLLTATVLATLNARERGSAWAYPLAAAAALTRYDAAGLIPGILLADLAERRPSGAHVNCDRAALRQDAPMRAAHMRIAFSRAALTALPLALWLLLTLLTWNERAGEHYLRQISERPGFEPGRTLSYAHRAAFDVERLREPLLLVGVSGTALARGLSAGLIVLALLGLAAALYARLPWMLVPACFVAGYLAVHTLYPFGFPRFGYPLAPVYLLLAGMGLRLVVLMGRALGASTAAPTWMAALAGLPGVQRLLLLCLGALAGVVLLPLLVVQALAFDYVSGQRFAWAWPLQSLAWGAAAALILFRALSPGSPLQRLMRSGLGVIAALVLLAHLHTGGIRVGGRDDQPSVLAGARWLLEHADPRARIASPSPGLLRFLANAPLDDRYVDLRVAMGDAPGEWLADLRAREVGYILWYDTLPAEVGGYYLERGRLSRFTWLERPAGVEGATRVAEFPGRPQTWIYRLEEQDPTAGND